ncbi:MAG: hypothetical protein LBG89_00265 [Rickettsiales bacterium]|jgi:hypothetical protein|nr:hypothetical protein [Rickettsiales bacterium]
MKTLLKLLAVPFAAAVSTDASAVVYQNNYATSRPSNSPYSYAQTRSEPAPIKDNTIGAYASFSVMKGFASWTNDYTMDVMNETTLLIEKVSASDSLDYSPFGISGAIGVFNKNLRGELEFNYVFPYSNRFMDPLSDTYHSFDFGNYSVMFNGYWDFGSKKWAVRPYIGVGVGLNIAEIEQAVRTTTTDPSIVPPITSTIVKESYSSARLSGQGMLGLYGEVGNGVYVDLGYKLVMNGDASMSQPVIWSNTALTGSVQTKIVSDPTHFLRLGVRFDI